MGIAVSVINEPVSGLSSCVRMTGCLRASGWSDAAAIIW